MNTQHEKSPCCGAKINHFGSRRRQCSFCKKTWRVWRKKRGRNKKRLLLGALIKYFDGDFVSIAKEARRRHIHESSLRRRLKCAAIHLVEHGEWLRPEPSAVYILLADAIIKRIRGAWYSAYIMALKDIRKNDALLLPPVILPNRESHGGWTEVLNGIPDQIWKNIAAIVSDGHRGIIDYAHYNNVKVQRCQAHLLMAIAGRRSYSKWSRHRDEGEKLYRFTQIMFGTRDEEEFRKAMIALEEMGWLTKSVQLKKVISGFLTSAHEYRTCLKYPELNIPSTNNAVESLISRFQELSHRAHGFASIEAFKIWIIAFVKFKRKITCNGFHQPN